MYGSYAGPGHGASSTGQGQGGNAAPHTFKAMNEKPKTSHNKDGTARLPLPIRWNTASRAKQQANDSQANSSLQTNKKLSSSPTKDSLNDSFIEDPEHKIMETPVHKSAVSHPSSKSGAKQGDSGSFTNSSKSGSRQGDSGSFTEELSQHSGSSSLVSDVSRTHGFNARLEDSSLIRAFVNQDVSDLSRSRARSSSRERNTMDSGSFTAETNRDIYRNYPVNLESSSHRLVQMPHTDVKPKFRPVIRPTGRPEARRMLQEDKENTDPPAPSFSKLHTAHQVTGVTPSRDLVLQKLENMDLNPDSFKTSSHDMTHPASSGHEEPGSNVLHQDYHHSSLRQQTSSRLKSAPALTSKQRSVQDESMKHQKDEIRNALKLLDVQTPNVVVENNKDKTDKAEMKTAELMTPQTTKQMPSFIQDLLRKTKSKPGLSTGKKTHRVPTRNPSGGDSTRPDPTFPCTDKSEGGTRSDMSHDLVMHKLNVSTEPTYPHNTASRNKTKNTLAEILETSSEKPHGIGQQHHQEPPSASRLNVRRQIVTEPTYPCTARKESPEHHLPQVKDQSRVDFSHGKNRHDEPVDSTSTYPSQSHHRHHHQHQRTSEEAQPRHRQEDPSHHPATESHTKQRSPIMAKCALDGAGGGGGERITEEGGQKPDVAKSSGSREPVASGSAYQVPGQVSQPSQLPGQVSQPSQLPGQVLQPSQLPGQVLQPSQLPGQVSQPSQICDDRTPRPNEQRVSRVAAGAPASVEARPAPAVPAQDMKPPLEKASMPPPPLPPPQIAQSSQDAVLIINNKRYRVLKVLGKGGSSKVYEAVDEQKNNVVAIKRVDLSTADEAQAAGYVNEINMLARLQGEDRIVKLYDYENDKLREVLYVVMEKGDTDLASLLKNYAQHKEIIPAMVKFYWTEMLHAVGVIHKRGIIHSDLKPANFLLVAGRLKLIDFGIASTVQSDMTSVMKDTQMGTFNFMSPEAIQDLSGSKTDEKGMRRPVIKISYKSDVWSLGCILYNLAYGKMPFGDIKIPVMKLSAIINPEHKIPFPTDNMDPQLVSVIKWCLTRDVKLRPSIQDLLAHPYVTGIESVERPDPAAASSLQSHMLAQLESNLAGVLSPGTFEKTRRALQDPTLAKKLNM